MRSSCTIRILALASTLMQSGIAAWAQEAPAPSAVGPRASVGPFVVEGNLFEDLRHGIGQDPRHGAVNSSANLSLQANSSPFTTATWPRFSAEPALDPRVRTGYAEPTNREGASAVRWPPPAYRVPTLCVM